MLGENGWVTRNLGGGTTTVFTETGHYPHVGVSYLQTSATQGHGGEIARDGAFGIMLVPSTQTKWETRINFRPDTSGNVRMRWGWRAGSLTVPTSGVWLRYDTAAGFADTTFKFEACHASTCTVVDSGVTPAASTWYTLKIRSTTVGTVLFQLDNGTEQSISTNITSNFIAPSISITTDTAAAKKMWVDYWAVKFWGLAR
jgi:hypothetical protein